MPLVLIACGMSHPQLDTIGGGAPHPLERGVEDTFTVIMPRPVTVDGGSSQGTARPLTGFLMGFDNPDLLPAELTTALKPQFWRLAGGGKDEVLKLPKFGPSRVSYILSDPYFCAACTAPWDNWSKYESDIGLLVSQNRAVGRPVTYWDVLNEPELFQIPGVTTERVLEAYKRAYTVIRATDPQAKISGPSTGNSYVPFMQTFLVYARDNNLRLDAISWHEFTNPESVPENIVYMKQLIKEYGLTTPSGAVPELHINEYAFASNHLIPGWTVGWLYYLDKNMGDLAWTSRSCWKLPPGIVGRTPYDCLTWLDGLLTPPGQPAPLYWVHRAQAEMSGGTILFAQSTSPRTVALATKNTQGETTILVGRYSCGKTGNWCKGDVDYQTDDAPAPTIPVTLKLTNLGPVATVQAKILRIPNQNLTGPLLQPVDMGTVTLPVTQGVATLTTPSFQDGDVYYITIKP